MSQWRYLSLPPGRRPPGCRPLVMTAPDPDLLRYLGTSVLCVPPGGGPWVSRVCTVALRAARWRWLWRATTPLLRLASRPA